MCTARRLAARDRARGRAHEAVRAAGSARAPRIASRSPRRRPAGRTRAAPDARRHDRLEPCTARTTTSAISSRASRSSPGRSISPMSKACSLPIWRRSPRSWTRACSCDARGRELRDARDCSRVRTQPARGAPRRRRDPAAPRRARPRRGVDCRRGARAVRARLRASPRSRGATMMSALRWTGWRPRERTSSRSASPPRRAGSGTYVAISRKGGRGSRRRCRTQAPETRALRAIACMRVGSIADAQVDVPAAERYLPRSARDPASARRPCRDVRPSQQPRQPRASVRRLRRGPKGARGEPGARAGARRGGPDCLVTAQPRTRLSRRGRCGRERCRCSRRASFSPRRSGPRTASRTCTQTSAPRSSTWASSAVRRRTWRRASGGCASSMRPNRCRRRSRIRRPSRSRPAPRDRGPAAGRGDGVRDSVGVGHRAERRRSRRPHRGEGAYGARRRGVLAASEEGRGLTLAAGDRVRRAGGCGGGRAPG